jgi:putative ABC transport system permease protein
VINIISLCTGLATAFFIYLWVVDELGVDNFHVNKNRLFQVYENRSGPRDINTSTTTSAIMGEALMSEIPEVEHAINVSWSQYATVSLLDKNVKAKGYYVGEAFFEMFSFDIVQGDKQTVLADPSSIVISKSLAMKLFHSVDKAIGESLDVQIEKTFATSKNQTFKVSGVFADIPQNASDHFDFVLPFQAYLNVNNWLSNWEVTATRTFVLLKPDAAVDLVNQKLADYIKLKTNNKVTHRTPFLNKYSEIYLYSEYNNGVRSGGRITYVKLFVFVGAFVLLIACMNFMNLSTARITRRLKEVSVRKIVGATRTSLVTQCLLDAFVTCILAAFIAILIVNFLLPEFNTMTGKSLRIPYNSDFIISAFCIVLAAGLLAGSYPAIYISSLNPKRLLRSTPSSLSELLARKGLVVFQFSLSTIFILAILITYNQLNFVQSAKLGYKNDNIVYFVRDGRLMEDQHLLAFLEELGNTASIEEASSISHDLTGHNSGTTNVVWEGKSTEDNTEFERIVVNHGMLPMLGIELQSGRMFSKDFVADRRSIVFNEKAIEEMGIKDPVGKTIQLEGKDFQIIGQVKDFNFESLRHSIKPAFFKLAPEETRLIMVKMLNGQEKKAIGDLQRLYAKHNPGFSFDHYFLEDEYRLQYEGEQQMSSLSMYFAVLAVVISCLGLIGLSAYVTEKRMKEIGIRKILGASVSQIVNMLSRDFIRIAFASLTIGITIAYFVLNSWLDAFAYRIELEWWYFGLTGIIILILSLLTVSIQTIKAASINPVNSLRND